MTIHPIFVHFPIAFLVAYSLIEICRFSFIKNSVSWQGAKKILLYAGTIMALITMAAGAHDEKLVGGPASYVPHDLVDIHSSFGFATFCIFALISLAYLFTNSRKYPNIGKFATSITSTWIVIVAAVIGLCIVVITGALGGAIVYSSTDPFGQLILHLLGYK